MRIIGGTHKGRILSVPRDLPVRPTTDFAKEALFNILQNRFDLSEMNVLDLFSGTGHISFEFASRGSQKICSVDQHPRCLAFQKKTKDEFSFEMDLVKDDVFEFLKHCSTGFDLIFADPPYDLPNIEEIHRLVFSRHLLKPGGWLILEHGKGNELSKLSQHLQERRYGGVHFSIFEQSPV